MGRINAARIYGFVIGLFAFAILASGANATVVVGNLGNLQPGDSDSFAQFTTNSAQLAGGEIIDFTVNSETVIGAAATTVNLGPIIGIGNFAVSLVENTGTDFSSFNTLVLGMFNGGVLTLSYSGLTNGKTYGLLFTGVIIGSVGGAYAGTYAVSAVPLPPAVWLFLSALIGLAGVARRKRKRIIDMPIRPKEAPLGA